MDPAIRGGGTPGIMESTGIPEYATRGVDQGAEGAAVQAPKTINAATARADCTKAQQVTRGAASPRHDDRGSAVPVTTKKQQKETGTKAEATENARIARNLPTRGPAYQ